ncbi:MAG: glyoxylate/hydroxypyruvate reductase A [Phaeodactylibacter sp.]|nr:glyoxylate/hydroxypyruvate reductase A [Phaeodactylibacter sp.]MCB9050944.1 glyoxylate/hydroxypyruvate reductase A [Lewinellaceae bacterium]
MSIALIITDRDVQPLRRSIETELQGATPVWIYPDIPKPEWVEMAVVWKHPPSVLKAFPNLELVSSLGAGVEHILNDATLPLGLRITRIVDDSLTTSMRNYVLMAVLNIHKQLWFYQNNQQKARWEKPAQIEVPLRIGMLGLGALGGNIASSLAGLGFEVLGFSQTPRNIPGVRCLNAKETSLSDFVRQINLLICLLPRTAATEDILNYDLFRQMPQGSFLINVARGAHLDEEGLLKAMKEGYIREAWLDVFREEPLPENHPFWHQPGLVITPHIASITNPENAAKIIAENYRRWKEGKELLFEVDEKKGY